ncbi:MAG: Bax inhibitor-1/YccA family protein [Chitinophagaceae bacterium]|nr:Bax inhibitor-1/YccA family protein [Chitinophagaceae bacterium]
MALFQSGNPALGEKTFQGLSIAGTGGEVMTAQGTMRKLGLLLLLMMGAAFYTWSGFFKGQNVQPLMWIGVIGGLVVALIITFKKEWAGYLAPAYALLEGLFIGAISAVFHYQFADSGMPGIILNAVGLTMGTAVAMFLLYNFRIIKATERFKSVVITATMGIAIFYGITMLLRLFGVQVPFMHDSSWLGIGISLFVVGIAALNLILDFDMIEQGAANGAPKYMEWYGAFGLMVTLVWLYLEILRLLSRFASRD